MKALVRGILLAIVSLIVVPLTASAAVITYDATHVSASQWIYNYSVKADTAEPPINEFTIYFDHALFADLSLLSSPQDWDTLIVQPDISLLSNGFLDALALADGLQQGNTVNGFSVAFTYLGSGIPGSQRFDIVDPITFSTITSGQTSLSGVRPPTGVNEPSSLLLLAPSLLGLLSLKRRSIV